MVRLPTSFLLALMLIVMTASGCVLPETEPASSASEADPSVEPESTDGSEAPDAAGSESAAPAAPAPEPNMTGEVTEEQTTVGLCLGEGLTNVYCATRSVLVEGNLTDLPALSVLLESFSGTLSVTTAEENVWSLEATMRSGGMSSSQARDNLDKITFQWSYLAEDGYALVATATSEDTNVAARHEASLALVLPAAVAPSLEAEVSAGRVLVDSLAGGSILATVPSGSIYVSDSVVDKANVTTGSGSVYITNLTAQSVGAEAGRGSINADDVTADLTELRTSSGSVYGNIRGVDAVLGSSSGSVYASFVPTASGALTITGGAASLDLSVPEGDDFGYDVEASSGTGSVEIFLEDGNATHEDRSATFLTENFAERGIQTVVRLTTGSGSIVVYPIEE